LFLGHQAAVQSLYSAATSGKLHHGWLITGQPGVGKATLAYRFARWLLAGGEAADLGVDAGHPVFRRVAAGTHPDLFSVERRVNERTERMQSEIVVNTVQEAGKFMRLTPAEGGWRVVVIDGAEDMNTNAANALLKILEEPPPRAILLLARYAPELPAAGRARLLRLAEGSIGTALNLAAEGGVGLAELVDEVLDAPVTAARAQAIAESVTRQVEGADKFEVFFGLLRAGLAARVRHAARTGGVGPEAGPEIWQDFGKMQREVLGLNLDKRAAIIVAISQLHGS
jgi:DNA polymerase-3 subunit delta'